METADEPGIYKNFSGCVFYNGTNCVVRNADFEISEKQDVNGKSIIFDDAVFVSGFIRWSVVKNGLNLDCDFSDCEIEYMINKSGGIFGCGWHDGIFEGGVFEESWWHDGIWIKGVWDSSINSDGKLIELPPDQ